MNELIKISYENAEHPTVSGRELHKALEVETRYNDWFKRMCEYGFSDNEDFYSILSKTIRRRQTEYRSPTYNPNGKRDLYVAEK